MATAYISTSTELSLVNTLNQSLTLYLPENSDNGKNLFIKDAAGNSAKSTITVLTTGVDRFEDGSLFQTLNSAYESIQFNYNSNIWYFTGGTTFNTLRVSTVQSQNTQTQTLSTNNISLSSFQISDNSTSTLGTFDTVSSLLCYNGFVLGGGLRTAIPQTLNTSRFSVQSLQNLVLWLDAADTSTVVLSSGSNVSQWRDKTTNFNHAISVGTVSYENNNRRMNLVSGGRFSGNLLISGNTQAGISISIFCVATTRTSFIGGNSRLLQLMDGTTITSINEFNSPNTILINYVSSNINIRRNTQNMIIGTVPLNQIFLTTLVCNIYGTTLININGSTSGGQFLSNLNTSITNTLLRYSIGAGLIFGDNWNGWVNEVIVSSSSLSFFERQQMEGYLAWKWNLQDSLPASHLFKNTPP